MDAVCWVFGGSHRHGFYPVFRVGSASDVCACGMSCDRHDPCLGRDLHRIEKLEEGRRDERGDCRLHPDDAGGKAIVGHHPGALEFRVQTRRQPCFLDFNFLLAGYVILLGCIWHETRFVARRRRWRSGTLWPLAIAEQPYSTCLVVKIFLDFLIGPT